MCSVRKRLGQGVTQLAQFLPIPEPRLSLGSAVASQCITQTSPCVRTTPQQGWMKKGLCAQGGGGGCSRTPPFQGSRDGEV